MSDESENFTFSIPDRVEGSMNGSAFGASILHMIGDARELAIVQQLELGNIPDFMRKSRKLTLSGNGHSVTVEVLPDVLCIGTDDDFLRVPMNPRSAQRIADLFGAVLITPFLSDQVWKHADVQIDPMLTTMPPTQEMTSTKWFIDQQAKVEKIRAGRGGLIAGHKKDVVVANSLSLPQFHDRVAIYGWHQRNGVPIQGLNPSKNIPPSHTHVWTYWDYSHGIRLISEEMLLDGEEAGFDGVAVTAGMCELVNGSDGPLSFLRYPTA